MAQDHPFRAWRDDEGLTLSAIAERVGVTPSHISDIETGKNIPSLPLADKLSSLTKNRRGVPAVPIEAFVPRG